MVNFSYYILPDCFSQSLEKSNSEIYLFYLLDPKIMQGEQISLGHIFIYAFTQNWLYA